MMVTFVFCFVFVREIISLLVGCSNRVFTEGTCKLLSLVISDLVDEDFVLHKRQQAVSALIFGTSALLSKPGQSFAPLVGSLVLSLQTGKRLWLFGKLVSASGCLVNL